MNRLSCALLQAKCMQCSLHDKGLCAIVQADTLARLASTGTQHDYPVNRTVWDEGTAPVFVGLLVSGYLRLARYRMDGRRQIVSLMTPGDIIGGTGPGIFAGYTLEAATDVRICRFESRVFDRLMGEDRDLPRAVYRLRAAKLDRLRRQIWWLGVLTAEERLCGFLASATRYMPFAPQPGGGGTLTVDLPRSDIADLLAISVETISRITRCLDASGVIRIRDPRHFEIPDLGKLVEIGCFQDVPGNVPPLGAIPENGAFSGEGSGISRCVATAS